MADTEEADTKTEESPLIGETRRSKPGCRVCLPLTVAIVLCLAVALGLVLGLLVFNDVTHSSASGYYEHGAVATDAEQCSGIGRDILEEKGGSAVDAAIATSVCVGIHSAQSCGVGGGDIWVIYDTPRNSTEKVMVVLDSREVAPLAATRNMSIQGILSAGVPGNVLGLYEAWLRFGRVPWRQLLEPTIGLCREGFKVGHALAETIAEDGSDIMSEPNMREIFVKADGTLYGEGDVMTRPKMADTLEILAEQGGRAYYSGSLAADIVADVQEQGGLITLEDLEQYTVKWRQPISVPLWERNLTLHTAPPPFSGAIYQFIVNLIDGYHMPKFSSGSTEDEILRYHRIVEAFKHGFAIRTYLGDPDFTDPTQILANLTSRDYVDSIRRQISDHVTHGVMYYNPQYRPPAEGGTSHVSVLAPDGAAVSLTQTVNGHFGCNRRGGRTGIIFNDEMRDFNSPDDVISGDLLVAGANLIEPGKRPLSSMCPTIVVDRAGDVVQAIGGAGSKKIVTGTALATMYSLLFGDKLNSAIDRVRVHNQLIPDIVEYEDGLPEEVVQGLRAKGHVTVNSNDHSILHGIQSYCKEPGMRDACIMAVSDWRKRGRPNGF